MRMLLAPRGPAARIRAAFAALPPTSELNPRHPKKTPEATSYVYNVDIPMEEAAQLVLLWRCIPSHLTSLPGSAFHESQG
jgi:hypothetical protein